MDRAPCRYCSPGGDTGSESASDAAQTFGDVWAGKRGSRSARLTVSSSLPKRALGRSMADLGRQQSPSIEHDSGFGRLHAPKLLFPPGQLRLFGCAPITWATEPQTSHRSLEGGLDRPTAPRGRPADCPYGYGMVDLDHNPIAFELRLNGEVLGEALVLELSHDGMVEAHLTPVGPSGNRSQSCRLWHPIPLYKFDANREFSHRRPSLLRASYGAVPM